MYDVSRDEYFNDFLAAACSAAPLGLAELMMCVDCGVVPCHCFAGEPGYQRAAIGRFVIVSDQTMVP